MSNAVTIQVQAEAVTKALAALAARVNNPGAALEAVAEGMRQRVQARFTSQTGPDGQAWKPNSPATRKRKGNKPILRDSGELRASIVGQAVGNQLVLSSDQPYAAIHQFGGTIERQAGQVTVRHRTDARGNLLRSAIMNGRGLVFAKKEGHKRQLVRSFDRAAYTITMPARPFMPVRADGSLYPAEQAAILAEIEAWLGAGTQGP